MNISLLKKLLFVCLLTVPPIAAAERIQKISIEGLANTPELEKNAYGYLSANEYLEKKNLSELFIRQIFLRGQREIAKALQPFGYYQPNISGSVEQTDQQWALSFNVDKGKQSYWRRITVQVNGAGAEDPLLSGIIGKYSIWPGQPVSHQAYETLKTSLEKTALNNGYLDAHWQSSALKVGPVDGDEARPVDIVLILRSGPRFYFGDVHFNNAQLSNKLLSRYLPFSKGDLFTAARYRQLQYRLNDSEYFSSVKLSAPTNNARKQQDKSLLDIQVDTKMRKRNLYSFGGGYGTDTGARGSVGWQARWLNSYGHKFNSELEGSQIGANAKLRYSIPLRKPNTDRLSFHTTHSSEEQPEGKSRLSVGGISLSRRHRGWQWQLYSQYQHEQFTLSGESQRSDLLIFGIGADRRRADKLENSGHGYRFSWDIHGAHDSLLSDTSFLQANASYRRLDTINDQLRLISQLQLGANLVSKFSEVPLSERYFTGGDQTVRGYKYKTLATRDANGDLIGGQYLANSSLELEYLIGEQWGVAIFADAGNAFDSLDEGFHTGAGFGLRWRLPVGSLRVDVAAPVDDLSEVRLHLSLGPDL